MRTKKTEDIIETLLADISAVINAGNPRVDGQSLLRRLSENTILAEEDKQLDSSKMEWERQKFAHEVEQARDATCRGSPFPP